MSEKLDSIETQNKEILTKLGEIAESGGDGKKQPPRPQGPDPKTTYKVPVGDAHTKGPATAKVTVVEWSDFQCPFCSRVVPTMEEITKTYGDDVRIAFKHNPLSFHPRAMPAAIAAEAAGKQGKFFEMHDKLFANQKELTDENFVTWAKELGLDVDKFKKDLTDPALKKKAEAHQAEGMRLGARGTPAFFVNGRFLSGAQPFPAFKALIDEEMKKADKLISDGTARDKVYDEVIKNGKTAV